ncbi:MAG: protealysin inhibitor emfourin [Vicinamibacterales bacterium]
MTILSVTLTRSGGFAGLIRQASMPGADLKTAERTALEHLLASRAPHRDPQARDQLVYELEVETPDGRTRVEFDELHVPQGIAPLIARMGKGSE